MQTYIVLLRGINVSGHNIIKMEDLRKLFSELGFSFVKTYIQSGNIVILTNPANIQELESIISYAIKNKFILEIPVMVLELDEFIKVVENNPFFEIEGKDRALMHITFLTAIPEIEKISYIDFSKFLPDEIIIIEKAIYMYFPKGYGKTKLTNGYFESKLKLKATTRNLKTCYELIKIAREID
jgi:uncharacterized protein (DUF1697 family)